MDKEEIKIQKNFKNTNYELIFVYNADSTLSAQVSDFARKLIAPNTYKCNLCMITYGLFEMSSEWKEFLDTLPLNKTFLHRDEFLKKYPDLKDTKLPAILINSNQSIKEFIGAEEINRQKDVQGLKNLLIKRLQDIR